MAKFVKYTQADLDKLLDKSRDSAVVHCRLLRELVGGQPATDKGLEAFIEHHLDINPQRDTSKTPTNPEFIAAFERIKKEELGKKDAAPPEGELEEEKVYGVNNIRSTEHGIYIAAHQIKACIKCAASRLGLFSKSYVGSKGDVVEMGTVMANGQSLLDPARPWEVYLLKNGRGITTRRWTTLRGTVNTPQGKKSIQYDAEVADEGSEFEFKFLWGDFKFTREMFVKAIAATTAIGLGSALSLGYGKFEVIEMTVGKEE